MNRATKLHFNKHVYATNVVVYSIKIAYINVINHCANLLSILLMFSINNFLYFQTELSEL
jgi:hypothetical protein